MFPKEILLGLASVLDKKRFTTKAQRRRDKQFQISLKRNGSESRRLFSIFIKLCKKTLCLCVSAVKKSYSELRLVSVKNYLSISCFIFTFLLICHSIYSQNPTPTVTPEITKLELLKPIEREISGTTRQSYQINLAANQYVKILVEQRGIDIGIRLYGTDKKRLADFDAELKSTGTEIIEFIAQSEGVYKFEITSKFPFLPAGKYEIRLVDLHKASEKEKILQTAWVLQTDSIRFLGAGKYIEAKQAIEKAIEINKKELGLENQTVVLNLTLLARITDAQSDYDQAEKINQQVLAIEQKIFEPNHPHTANTLNYLATNYNHQENYPKAIEYHQRALAMREEIYGKSHPAVAASLINLGVVFDALGDKEKTLELYQRALDIQEKTAGAESFNTAVVYNNIGKIYNDLDDFQKAKPFALRAVAILEKIYQPDNPRIFDALSNLAECYVGEGNLAESELLYTRILAFREKSVGTDHPLTAHAAYNLGNIFAIKKDHEKAESLYRQALEIRENKFGTESPAVSEVLSALSLLLATKGDINQSLSLQQRSNSIDERNIALNMTIGSERQKLAFLNNLFDRTNQSLFLQTKFAPDNPLAIELAVTTVLRKKGRVLDAVSNNLSELRRRSNPQDIKLLDDFSNITQQISELILEGAEETPLAEHQLKIKNLTDESEKLEDEISRRVAGFYPISQPVTLQAVQAVIPNEFALIEFAIYTPDPLLISNAKNSGKERYVVYVLQNQGEVKWKDLGEAKQIDAEINNLQQALRDPKRNDVKAIARRVDEKVMQPIRSLLGDAKKLFISPDGELNLIPFEALVDEQNKYLIENYSFTYLTSGRDLLRIQTARTSKSNSLVIANPTFGQPSAEQISKLEKINIARNKRQSVTVTRNLTDTYFAPIVNTAIEGRSIQTLFPDATILTEAKATESALKQTIAPKILHLATHGFFLENKDTSKNAKAKIENPLLRSGLAFAGANQQNKLGDDGILTALEASGLNLWGTKLVVLSACETGLGEVRNGEGVYGLRRAFVIAGTESLVMSLWSVSDLITRKLMTDYYTNLKNGMGRNSSLRQVQLKMLKKEDRKHPFYWASFIQSGDWANLEGKR